MLNFSIRNKQKARRMQLIYLHLDLHHIQIETQIPPWEPLPMYPYHLPQPKSPQPIKKKPPHPRALHQTTKSPPPLYP